MSLPTVSLVQVPPAQEYKFKMKGRLEFVVQSGVRHVLATRIQVDGLALDPASRLKFVARGNAQQTAQWGEGAGSQRGSGARTFLHG